MISAYIELFATEASDRGCTGGSEGAVNVGPPGEISGGVFICQVARSGLLAAAPVRAQLEKSRPANFLPQAGK